MEGVAELVDEALFEIPDVPDKGGFVKGPLGHAWHVGVDFGD